HSALAPSAQAQMRRVAQLYDDLGEASLQRLAGADEYRDPVPAPVFDHYPGRGKGFTAGVGFHARLVQVPLVLTSHRLRRVERLHTTQDPALGPADVVG